MAKQQPPKHLFKGQERVSSYRHDLSPIKLMRQVSRNHKDVLQNIESVLVRRYDNDPDMDDRAAIEVLRASLNGTEPSNPRVAELVDRLAAVRAQRDDVSDELWRDALRVVSDSVRRHSELQPGEKGYLQFASQFIR